MSLYYVDVNLLLSILPAGQPSAAALVDLGTQTGNSVTWKANLPVGAYIFPLFTVNLCS